MAFLTEVVERRASVTPLTEALGQGLLDDKEAEALLDPVTIELAERELSLALSHARAVSTAA